MTSIRSSRGFALLFVLACMVGGLFGFSLVYVPNKAPPVVLRGVKEVDGLVVRAGSLDLLFNVRRERECSPTVDRWVWQDTAMQDRQGRLVRRFVTLPPASNPPVPLREEVTYILSIPLPSNVQPGKWFYRSRSVDHCNWLPSMASPARESPSTPVTVLDGSPHSTSPPAFEQLMPADASP